MILTQAVLLAIVVMPVIILMWIYGIYVSLIKKRNKAQEAFSSIDVQMKKRYDLIPNILTIAQKFMEHERGLMEEVTKLRTQAVSVPNGADNAALKMALDGQIAQKMGQLMVAVENYPDLKSDETMKTAMLTYNEVEEHISAARRFYNSASLALKNAVEIFPSSLIAAIMGIKAVDFIQATEQERQRVNASDFLK